MLAHHYCRDLEHFPVLCAYKQGAQPFSHALLCELLCKLNSHENCQLLMGLSALPWISLVPGTPCTPQLSAQSQNLLSSQLRTLTTNMDKDKMKWKNMTHNKVEEITTENVRLFIATCSSCLNHSSL